MSSRLLSACDGLCDSSVSGLPGPAVVRSFIEDERMASGLKSHGLMFLLLLRIFSVEIPMARAQMLEICWVFCVCWLSLSISQDDVSKTTSYLSESMAL